MFFLRYSSIVLKKKTIKEYRDKNNTEVKPEIQIKTTREKQVETCHEKSTRKNRNANTNIMT